MARFGPFRYTSRTERLAQVKAIEAEARENSRARSLLAVAENMLPADALLPETLLRVFEFYTDYRFGYISGESKHGRIADEKQRVKIVCDMRQHFASDPLIWAAFRTYWSFVFGRGLRRPQVSAAWSKSLQGDAAEPPDVVKALDKLLTQVWLDPITQFYLGNLQAQQRMYMRLKQDGELPILVCGNGVKGPGARFGLMVIDSLEIPAWEKDPKHPGIALAWERSVMGQMGIKTSSEWYADIETAIAGDGLPTIDYLPADIKLIDNKWLYVVNEGSDPTSPRGLPVWMSALGFAREVKSSCEDMRTYIKALTNWAWKEKVTGGQAKVNQMSAQVGSTLDLTHPVGPVAKIRSMGMGRDLEPIEIGTGGANAFTALIKDLKLMVCAATGLPAHLFGDVAAGRLTTAASLDVAVVKTFQSEQRFVESIFDVLFRKLALMAGLDVADTEELIQIDFPELDTKDAAPMLTAMAALKQAGFPGPEIAEEAAKLLGADPDKWVERMEQDAANAQANVQPQSLTEFNSMVDRAAEAQDEDTLARCATFALRFAGRAEQELRKLQAREHV